MEKLNRIINVLSVGMMAVAVVLTIIYLVDISNANKKVADLEKQVTNLEESYRDLQITADDQKAQSEGRIDKLKAKIDELEAKNKDLENENKELWTANHKLELEVEDLKAPAAEKESNLQPVLETPAEEKGIVGSAVIIKNDHGYITEIEDDNPAQRSTTPSGAHLTPSGGVFYFGNQLETYYNLDMSVIVQVAHSNGIGGEYWIREDGCKMLGEYIMLACNRDVHPYGSIVETSLGLGISLDTGGFAANNPYQVDIATNW